MRRTFIQRLLLSVQFIVGGFALLQDDPLWKARLMGLGSALFGLGVGIVVGAAYHHWLNQQAGRPAEQ